MGRILPIIFKCAHYNFYRHFADVTLPQDDVEDMIIKLRQLLSKGKSDQDIIESGLNLSSMSINSKNTVTAGRSVMNALGLKVRNFRKSHNLFQEIRF